MQRRALLSVVATLPLAGCGSLLDDTEETPTRAVPATFETTVDLSKATNTHDSPTESKPAEEP
ncbi:hypothetical protein [Halomarina oriensis]|uniref:Uncharacterized protein n=1 Tax=Halomarina oriensis TaxID=671145 RepID=A0A6B0GQI4_9EURY|nr:hypothetical protein [Halomarina oriensis]MWG35627.1 hypothetical protein [Halomarina oriensis]